MIKKSISVVLVLLIAISIMPVTSSAATTYHVSYYTTYDTKGNPIRASKQIGKLHSNLAEDMFRINGNRAYCIELDTPSKSTDTYVANTSSASSAWNKLTAQQRTLIRMIMCLGLEGNNKGSATTKTVNGHKIDFYNMYGKNVTVHEIYLATQLLIWEVTEGYRSTNRRSNYKTRYNLSLAYNNNIRGIYNGIVSKILQLNQRPSFCSSSNKTAPSYSFKVKHSTSGFSIASSDKVLTDKNGVLKNYASLASNRSIKVTYKNQTRYLNVKTSISGNKLTLHPNSLSSKPVYSTTKSVSAKEENIPSSSSSPQLTTYGEVAGKTDIQDLVGASSHVDPVNAYYQVGVEVVDSELSQRNFRINKSMKIQGSETEVESMEQGYYYYVALPSDDKEYGTSTQSTYKYYDRDSDSIVTGKTWSQSSAKELGLNTSSRLYNKELKEYYIIIGPTNSEGVTGTIRTYMRRYIDSTITTTSTGKQVPYGNYYVFELGKKGADFKASSTVNGDDSNIDLNPSHYVMPQGVTCYNFTYQEHLQAKDNKSYLANRDGIDTSTEEGKIEYYKRLKRYLCSYSATEEGTSTVKNYTKVKVRLTKTADDGQINNVFFKVSKLNSDGDVISTSTWGGTNADGFIEKWIDEGTYKVEEIGYGPQGSLPSYVTLPNPITFTVDTDVVEEYDDIGYYSITMNNKATIHIRVQKSDKSNSNKYVNGAKYGIYNDKGKLLEELITDTVQVGNITYEGFAISNDTYPFGNYYIQEIEAPAGYLIDDTKYEFIVNADNLDKYQGSGPSYTYNHITIKTSDNPTSAYVTKTDITGSEELSGAKLVLKKGDEVIDTWTSSTEPHKIYGLVFGTEYTLSETISPDGYSTTESITFTYSEDGQIVQMKDDTTKYQFVKKDNKGNILSGAKLQLSDEDTKDVVAEWTTSDTPYTVSKLTVGKTYRLKELSAPSPRYKLADDITFTVKDTSEIQTITMTDEIYYGSVTIQKQDDEGNNLGGAEFELYKSDGTKLSTTKNDDGKYSVSSNGTVTSMSTDDNGKLLIDTLELGKYYLTESKAPNGKLPYTGKIEFTISSDSEESLNQSFTVKDDNVVMLDTGGKGYSIPLTIGIVLLLLSSSIIFIYYRRKKQ